MRFKPLLFIFLMPAFVTAQELYKPRDISQAYKNGTRSITGLPGENYWQNRGRYEIKIKASPPDRTVYGSEKITYFNNSSNSLKSLVLKLTTNIHKPGAPRLEGAEEDYLTKGVIIDSVFVNGGRLKWDVSKSFTVSTLPLPKPLKPNDSVDLSIAWHYDVSLRSNREGMIDPTTYFLAYFYPRVAVYDDYQGWDRNPFVESLEFYNDFNDYSLEVQVPKNYIVWATGNFENPEQVLKPSVYQKYKESLSSDEILHIATASDIKEKSVTAQGEFNTWRFSAKNITDVATGFSDHYLWDAGSVVADSVAKRRVSVQAAFDNAAKDFHHVARFTGEGISWLSTRWPGVAYPFNSMTVFQGYAGMEYPMMANDESYADTAFSKFVAKHEIAHSYMPFYMGINECSR